MQSVNSAPGSSQGLSKREQRAARNAGNASLQGREVTENKQPTTKREPTPPVGGVVFINNADASELRKLRDRVAELEAEKIETAKANDAAMTILKIQVSTLTEENGELQRQLAEKNMVPGTAEVTHCEVSHEEYFLQEAPKPLISDSNANPRGVPSPTAHDLRTTRSDLEPTFAAFRTLGADINTLRNDVQTLWENSRLSKDEIEKEFIPLLKRYQELNLQAAKTRQGVESGISRLKEIHAKGSFSPVPEVHIKSMSSMNILPMADIEKNMKDYDNSLKDCKNVIDKIEPEFEKVRRRFANARDDINNIIRKIETRTYYQIWVEKLPPKYEYVTSAMD